MKNSAILLCAGSGTRMKGSVKDKVLAPLLGKPVLAHSVEAFLESKAVSELVFVCRNDEQIAEIKADLAELLKATSAKFTYGGAERQDSVLNGIRTSGEDSQIVFIHDCARPLVRAENIRRLLAAAEADGAAVLAAKVVDTIKKIDSNPQDLRLRELKDLERPLLWAMQTPQVFRRDIILSSYESVAKNKIKITDDVAAATSQGHRVTIVENPNPNPKITVPQDLAIVEFLYEKGVL